MKGHNIMNDMTRQQKQMFVFALDHQIRCEQGDFVYYIGLDPQQLLRAWAVHISMTIPVKNIIVVMDYLRDVRYWIGRADKWVMLK